MRHLNSKTDYEDVVSDLKSEFKDEIKSGAARSVANAVTGTFTLTNGGRPVVLPGVEYEGAPVESLDEALCPYDVLRYTAVEELPDPDNLNGGYNDAAAGRASEALAIELQR